MRTMVSVVVWLLLVTPQSNTALNAFYKGTESFNGKDVSATATMSYSDGRAVMAVKGSKNFRMIYLQKEGVLRMVDDTGKMVVDIQEGTDLMTSEMSKQLGQLPPEQRQMAEQMMRGLRGAAVAPPTKEFVWTKEKTTVKGYECTWVNILEAGVKRAAYCGTASPDFKMSGSVLDAALGMTRSLGQSIPSFAGASGSGQAATRGFQWDTSKEGYPLISRCFEADRIILNLELDSFNRENPSEELFSIPKNYKKQ
jgi:hypothetical protein